MTMLATNKTLFSTLAIFGSVESFTATVESAADLSLHRKVDGTVDALMAKAKFFNGLAGLGLVIVDAIKGIAVVKGQYLDPEDHLIDSLTEVIEREQTMLATMTAKKAAIDRDAKLTQSHCDMLHSAYDDALNALAALIDTAKNMRAAIITRDLEAEPRDGKVFANILEMKRAILR